MMSCEEKLTALKTSLLMGQLNNKKLFSLTGSIRKASEGSNIGH